MDQHHPILEWHYTCIKCPACTARIKSTVTFGFGTPGRGPCSANAMFKLPVKTTTYDCAAAYATEYHSVFEAGDGRKGD